MNEVTPEMAFKNYRRAIGYRAPGQIVNQQIQPHARRHTEYGGEAQRNAITTFQHGLFRFDFRCAVKRNWPQRCFLSAERIFLADAITGIGGRVNYLFAFAGEAHQQ